MVSNIENGIEIDTNEINGLVEEVVEGVVLGVQVVDEVISDPKIASHWSSHRANLLKHAKELQRQRSDEARLLEIRKELANDAQSPEQKEMASLQRKLKELEQSLTEAQSTLKDQTALNEKRMEEMRQEIADEQKKMAGEVTQAFSKRFDNLLVNQLSRGAKLFVCGLVQNTLGRLIHAVGLLVLVCKSVVDAGRLPRFKFDVSGSLTVYREQYDQMKVANRVASAENRQHARMKELKGLDQDINKTTIELKRLDLTDRERQQLERNLSRYQQNIASRQELLTAGKQALLGAYEEMRIFFDYSPKTVKMCDDKIAQLRADIESSSQALKPSR